MRLAYTADLHGNITWYQTLLDVAAQADAHAVIVGGDLLPHAITRATALQTQRAFVEQELRPLLETFRAAHPAIAVYLLAGNDDWAAAIQALDGLAADGLAHPLHGEVYQLGAELWLAGYACVPLTPFSIKDYECADDDAPPSQSFAMAYTSWSGTIRSLSAAAFRRRSPLAADLAALASHSDPARTIYVCHAPPFDTPLDHANGGRHLGSRSIRQFIEHQHPLAALHGHIHEAPRLSGRFATQIGRTWCINPGNDELRFHAVLFDTDDIAGTLDHTIYGRLDTEVEESRFHV